jgi:uncharacterized lipoprotein YddW (UPF0748 family)
MDRLARGIAKLVLIGGPLAISGQPWERGSLYAPVGDTVAPALGREFRAAWIATVSNIDWPSKPGLSSKAQQQELVALFDLAKRLNLNAIIFQVRPSGDALYRSSIEPWSYFLTRAMGRAPSPAYDPLAFAVSEAHARGLELHAWFNPYRARHPDDRSPAARGHVSRRSPGLVRRYGPYQWMDPGEPATRRLTTRVILDVVTRYDVDGIHIDDYFYPYPERDRRGREIPFPDDRSWRAYQAAGGKLTRDDWRRQNVDDLVRALYDGIKRTKPWVKFGVSPFGIWRPGYPERARGMDAYEKLFADSRRWLNEGWVDYFVPQLYWRLSAPQQPYVDLLRWWAGENTKGRHVWPGNFTNRASADRPIWPIGEIFEQIAATRQTLGDRSGNVHFSIQAFVSNSDSLVERLEAGPYAEPALVPASPWLAKGTPNAPSVTAAEASGGIEVRLPAPAAPRGVPKDTRSPAASSSSARWLLVRALYPDGWRARLEPANTRVVRLARDPSGSVPDRITLSYVDRTGNESESVLPLVVAPADSAPDAGPGPALRRQKPR